jgi:hypothetical protein
VSHAHRRDLADRKALLKTRAEFDRSKVSLAILEIRSIIAPESIQERMAGVRPAVAVAMNLVAPLLGYPRIAKLLRFASIALLALRIARNWK